jgi:hypothetical protein
MEVGLEVRNITFEQMTRKWRLFRSYVEGHPTLCISELDDMVKRLQVSQYKLTKQCLNYRIGGRAKTILLEQQLSHCAFQQAYITNEKGHALWGTAWRTKLLLAVVPVVADESDDEAGDANNDDDDDDDGNNGDNDDDDYGGFGSVSSTTRWTKAERDQLNDAIKDRKRKGPKSNPTRKKVVRQSLEEVFKALGFTKDGVEIESDNEGMAEYYDRMQKEEEEKARYK